MDQKRSGSGSPTRKKGGESHTHNRSKRSRSRSAERHHCLKTVKKIQRNCSGGVSGRRSRSKERQGTNSKGREGSNSSYRQNQQFLKPNPNAKGESEQVNYCADYTDGDVQIIDELIKVEPPCCHQRDRDLSPPAPSDELDPYTRVEKEHSCKKGGESVSVHKSTRPSRRSPVPKGRDDHGSRGSSVASSTTKESRHYHSDNKNSGSLGNNRRRAMSRSRSRSISRERYRLSGRRERIDESTKERHHRYDDRRPTFKDKHVRRRKSRSGSRDSINRNPTSSRHQKRSRSRSLERRRKHRRYETYRSYRGRDESSSTDDDDYEQRRKPEIRRKGKAHSRSPSTELTSYRSASPLFRNSRRSRSPKRKREKSPIHKILRDRERDHSNSRDRDRKSDRDFHNNDRMSTESVPINAWLNSSHKRSLSPPTRRHMSDSSDLDRNKHRNTDKRFSFGSRDDYNYHHHNHGRHPQTTATATSTSQNRDNSDLDRLVQSSLVKILKSKSSGNCIQPEGVLGGQNALNHADLHTTTQLDNTDVTRETAVKVQEPLKLSRNDKIAEEVLKAYKAEGYMDRLRIDVRNKMELSEGFKALVETAGGKTTEYLESGVIPTDNRKAGRNALTEKLSQTPEVANGTINVVDEAVRESQELERLNHIIKGQIEKMLEKIIPSQQKPLPIPTVNPVIYGNQSHFIPHQLPGGLNPIIYPQPHHPSINNSDFNLSQNNHMQNFPNIRQFIGPNPPGMDPHAHAHPFGIGNRYPPYDFHPGPPENFQVQRDRAFYNPTYIQFANPLEGDQRHPLYMAQFPSVQVQKVKSPSMAEEVVNIPVVPGGNNCTAQQQNGTGTLTDGNESKNEKNSGQKEKPAKPKDKPAAANSHRKKKSSAAVNAKPYKPPSSLEIERSGDIRRSDRILLQKVIESSEKEVKKGRPGRRLTLRKMTSEFNFDTLGQGVASQGTVLNSGEEIQESATNGASMQKRSMLKKPNCEESPKVQEKTGSEISQTKDLKTTSASTQGLSVNKESEGENKNSKSVSFSEKLEVKMIHKSYDSIMFKKPHQKMNVGMGSNELGPESANAKSAGVNKPSDCNNNSSSSETAPKVISVQDMSKNFKKYCAKIDSKSLAPVKMSSVAGSILSPVATGSTLDSLKAFCSHASSKVPFSQINATATPHTPDVLVAAIIAAAATNTASFTSNAVCTSQEPKPKAPITPVNAAMAASNTASSVANSASAAPNTASPAPNTASPAPNTASAQNTASSAQNTSSSASSAASTSAATPKVLPCTTEVVKLSPTPEVSKVSPITSDTNNVPPRE